jgi:hypothetical protein
MAGVVGPRWQFWRRCWLPIWPPCGPIASGITVISARLGGERPVEPQRAVADPAAVVALLAAVTGLGARVIS